MNVVKNLFPGFRSDPTNLVICSVLSWTALITHIQKGQLLLWDGVVGGLFWQGSQLFDDQSTFLSENISDQLASDLTMDCIGELNAVISIHSISKQRCCLNVSPLSIFQCIIFIYYCSKLYKISIIRYLSIKGQWP